MGIVKIPEKTVYTCDACERNFEKVAHSLEGKMSMSCEGLDYHGVAVGPGDRYSAIFCNKCYLKIRDGLAELIKEIHTEYESDRLLHENRETQTLKDVDG